MSEEQVKVYNPGDTPVLITGPHTSVGGREWAVVRNTKEVQKLIEDGWLVKVEFQPGEQPEESQEMTASDDEQMNDTSGDNASAATTEAVDVKSQSRSNKKG